MNVKEYIFKYRLRRQPARQAIFPQIDAVRSILIIYESDMDESNAAVKAIETELRMQDKDVTLWGYCAKKELTTISTKGNRLFGKKEIGCLGKPSDDLINELQQHSHELVIDLTQHACLPLQYIAMYAHANFKAGLHLSNEDSDGIHDLLISMMPQPSPRYLYEQIMKYLQMISPRK